jgi:acyl carrier protein
MPEVRERVRAIIADELRIDLSEVDPDRDLVQGLGVDSLDAMTILMRLEDTWAIRFPQAGVPERLTVDDIVRDIVRLVNGTEHPTARSGDE